MDRKTLASILPKPRHRRTYTVGSLYGDKATFAMGCFAVAAAAAVTSWRIGGDAMWVITALLTLVALVRLSSIEVFLANDVHALRHPNFWKRLYSALGLFHVGLIGGWMATIFLLHVDHYAELLSVMVSLGFLIGAQGRNFSSLPLVRMQFALCLAPPVLALCLRSPLFASILGGFVIAFYFAIITTTKRTRHLFEQLLDISEENWRIAHVDPLTGLPNGASLRTAIRRAIEERMPFSLMMIDLDRFKRVNDTLGHLGGDEVLRQAADKLVGTAGPNALVAREWSDTFVVMQLTDADPRAPQTLAHEIVDVLGSPTQIHGATMQGSCSIGLALFPRDGANYERVSHKADMALYEAKAAGGGRVVEFQPGTPDRAADRLRLESDLRRAIETGTIEHFFQPIVTNREHRVVGCEALARWNHPTRGPIPPVEFLPVAEDSGLIDLLTEQSFNAGCRAAVSWPEHVAISINLSPSQLCRPDLVPLIANALETTGLAPERLEIEITENLLLDDRPDVLETLHRIRRLGVRLSLDDFGTGYSNLHQIAHLPIHKIKLDKSFLRDTADGKRAAFLTGAVQFIAPLGLDIVLEGVETGAQVALAAELPGITLLQGYAFGKAMPGSAIAEFLRRTNPGSRQRVATRPRRRIAQTR